MYPGQYHYNYNETYDPIYIHHNQLIIKLY